MSEFPRKFVMAAAATSLSLGVLGCGAASAEQLDNASLVERFQYDYTREFLGADQRTDDPIGCLGDTAYDTDPSRPAAPRASASLEVDGTLAVSPANGGELLRLVKIDSEQPLQPADEAAQRILDAYGCSTAPYAD